MITHGEKAQKHRRVIHSFRTKSLVRTDSAHPPPPHHVRSRQGSATAASGQSAQRPRPGMRAREPRGPRPSVEDHPVRPDGDDGDPVQTWSWTGVLVFRNCLVFCFRTGVLTGQACGCCASGQRVRKGSERWTVMGKQTPCR